MAKIERITKPEGLPPPMSEWSYATKVTGGEMLFIDGQVPIHPDGSIVDPSDFREQVRAVVRNIGVILKAGGMDYENLCTLTTFIAGQHNYPLYREVRTEMWPDLFGEKGYPTNTVMVLPSLYRDDFLIEIEAIAAR